MFDKLIEFIIEQINNILPFKVVSKPEKGVRFRLGKPKGGVLEAGFYWKFPYADNIITDYVVETTLTLPAQSLTTQDGVEIVIKGMIKYKIDNMETYLTEVYDPKDALSDISCSIAKKIIVEKSWKDCQDNEIDSDITKKIRVQIKKYGVDLIQFTLTDIAKIKSLRLFNEGGLLG
jgi:regulator of protease activity HflC (stomatin/prohibitin superfamily)